MCVLFVSIFCRHCVYLNHQSYNSILSYFFSFSNLGLDLRVDLAVDALLDDAEGLLAEELGRHPLLQVLFGIGGRRRGHLGVVGGLRGLGG